MRIETTVDSENRVDTVALAVLKFTKHPGANEKEKDLVQTQWPESPVLKNRSIARRNK